MKRASHFPILSRPQGPPHAHKSCSGHTPSTPHHLLGASPLGRSGPLGLHSHAVSSPGSPTLEPPSAAPARTPAARPLLAASLQPHTALQLPPIFSTSLPNAFSRAPLMPRGPGDLPRAGAQLCAARPPRAAQRSSRALSCLRRAALLTSDCGWARGEVRDPAECAGRVAAELLWSAPQLPNAEASSAAAFSSRCGRAPPRGGVRVGPAPAAFLLAGMIDPRGGATIRT